MAQVSYGTITITDTTDIEDVYLIYKGSSSNTTAPSITWSGGTNDWKTDITQVTGDYIWAITVFKRSGIAITSSNYTDYYSDPACLTGDPGQSISITSIKYSTATTQAQPADNTFTLNSPPTVPEGGWLWSRTLFSSGQSVYSKAKQGEKGDKGDDGISPTVSKTGDTVTITDAEGNTVTVTDGQNGQSYYTYIRYATDSSGSGMSTSPSGKTYIGVYSGTSATVPTSASSYTWSKYVGDNGQPGGTGPQGVSVTQVRELYYLTTGNAPSKPTSSTTIYDYDTVGAWTSVVPEYIVNGKYYISLETTLSNNTKVFSDVVLDQALTDACYNAAMANSISQSANENAQGALSQAAEAQYQTEALGAKLKYFFYPGDSNYPGVYAASGISGTTFNEGSISTYGYNVAIKPASISIGYNNIKAILIDGSNPSLKFYTPSKTTQATNPSMELSSTALTFNNPTTGQAQLTLSASGSLQSGNYSRGSDTKFASAGTKIDLTAGDIITQYFRLSQGGESGGPNAGAYIHGTIEALDGRIGTNSTNYWDIGNYTDYNLSGSAKLIGHGSSFIQLGDNLTWRLATNRIHTGWYASGDSYLHFPEFTDGSETRRWDYGLHVPTSKGDKFLYIRNANSTTSLANLIYDLEDSHTTHYWTYKFYIDGEGNVHAPGFFIGDSTTPIGGGTGTVAERLLNGGGTSNRPVYFPTSGDNLGKPVQITVTDNSSATAVSSTDTNLITARTLYYAGYVKSSGITSVTVAATSPVVSSTATAQTGSSASTTISLANAYGDTKNPYGSKTKNYVLAAPSDAAGTPSFRALVAADIPDLSGTYLTSHQTVTNKGATLSWGSAVTVATIGSTDIKVSLPSNPDTNTTYTFANGTNGFTVTPSGGSAQTVTVTPSITNNVTGSGTSGSLVKWNGANTITNGPALGTDTTKFLNNKGEWAVPTGTYTYTLPLAANGTRGGVQIGYTQSGKNYPVQLSSEKMYVNVPWENTTYSAGTGLSLSGTTFNHSNSVTAGTVGTSSATSGATLAVPYVTYDAQGHITGTGTHTHTVNNIPQADITWGGPALSASASPNEVSTIDDLGHNKFAFMSAASVVVHYSRDGGSTWTAYGSDADHRNLVTLSSAFRIGGPNAGTAATVNDQLRIQLNANIAGGNIYCNLRRILVYLSTAGSGGCTCTLQYKTIANYNNNSDTWTTAGTYNVSGWSGWNSIPFANAFGGSNTQTSQVAQIRLIFKVTSVSSTYTNLEVYSLRGIAFPLWQSPSTMASTGHLYTFDINQNATFPAQVTATKFNGNLTGNVTGNVSGSAGSVAWSGVTSKPTTLSGYGITDAKIASGVITLGSNTITPLTSATLVTGASNSKVNTAQSTNGNVYLNLVVNDNIQNAHNIVGSGTVTVTNDANGKITIAGSAHPTALKNPNALSIKVYNGTSTSSDTSYDGSTANQSVSVAGTSAITGISASAAAGGSTTFTLTKANGDTSTFDVTVTASVATGATKLTNSSGTAIDAGSASTPVYFSGGLPVALTSTTKIDYNLLPTGTTSSTVAIGNHTHTISLASDTGTTGVVNLSHGGKYKLTAGGSSVIFTLPSDNNTDTLVTQAYSTTNNSYPLLFTATAGITSTNSRGATTAILNNQIYANPNTGTITAVTFSGNATTATTASKLGSSTLGSSTKPIYLNSGTATECSTYAGGTKVTLNGDDKGASTASFYAPTSAGTANYVLISNGSGAPTWTAQSNITSGNSDENVKSTAVTAATTNYIVGSTTSTTTTGGLSKHASAVIYTTADSGTSGYAQLRLGNTTATSSAGGKEGQIRLYGTTATYYVDLKAGAPSANRTITLPNATGTVALVGSTTSSVATGITISDHSTTSIGSASNWNAGSASTWAFTEVTTVNSVTGAIDSNDNTQLNITVGTTTVQSKSSGANGTKPSLTITSTTVVNGKSHTITDNGHTHTNG